MFNSLKKIFSSNESSEENTNEISSLLTRLQQQQQSQIDLIKAQTEAIKHKDNYIELLLNVTKKLTVYQDARTKAPLCCIHDYLEESNLENRMVILNNLKLAIESSSEDIKDCLITTYITIITSDEYLYEVFKPYITFERIKESLLYLDETKIHLAN